MKIEEKALSRKRLIYIHFPIKIFPININYFTFDLLANKFCLYECDVTGCWIVFFLGDLKMVILLNGNVH